MQTYLEFTEKKFDVLFAQAVSYFLLPLGAAVRTCYLLDAVSSHVEEHGAVQYTGAKLKQTVQWQCGHVRFTPTLAAILHIFLKLQPPGGIVQQ